VQGVGFRPFVYRLATSMGLNGWVSNTVSGVFLEAEGPLPHLDLFLRRLELEKPPRALVHSVESFFLEPAGYASFEIRHSDENGEKCAVILPDMAPCAECLAEMLNPANRRYLYPFVNCTNCGPRFSIVQGLPYDRPNTTMRHFEMCPACEEEFRNPTHRRFHAQPNACPRCGPQLALWNPRGKIHGERHEALLKAAKALREGKIVALKGVGGFQLLVDARNQDAVRRLRERKGREEKPLGSIVDIAGSADCVAAQTGGQQADRRWGSAGQSESRGHASLLSPAPFADAGTGFSSGGDERQSRQRADLHSR
jgi:hydrogenase maturation protein HypF